MEAICDHIASQRIAATVDRCDETFSSTITNIIDGGYDSINSRCYEELPEDLTIQIFIRLPVKSVLLVKCVCRRWYMLVKDQGFVCKHLEFQKMISKTSGDFLLKHHQINEEHNFLLFGGEFVSSTATSSNLPLLSNHNLLHFCESGDTELEIEGPINGLYCLHNRECRIFIWNPATNEVFFVPFPDHQCLPDGNYDEERGLVDGVIGFGTDPLDKEDYKVVLISECIAEMDFTYTYGMLYTTRTNSWRFLKDKIVCFHSLRCSLNNTFLNGSMYWIGICDYIGVVFDMSKDKEAFRKITTPCANGDLALHDEHITMFSVNKNLNEVEIWVMLEESNWVKKHSVREIQASVVRPLGFWRTESELLLVICDSGEMSRDNTRTVLYNTITREIRIVGPRGHSRGFKAVEYYESLVSLGDGIAKFKGNDRLSLWERLATFFNLKYGESSSAVIGETNMKTR